MRVPIPLVILAVLVSPLVSAGIAPTGDEPSLRLRRAIWTLTSQAEGSP